MGWLGSGLGAVHAFKPLVIVLFDVCGALLLGSSIYFIRKARSLLRTHTATFSTSASKINRPFIVIVILEVVLIAYVGKIAYLLRRPDLAPVLARNHRRNPFLPLGKIFRQPRFYFLGTAIVLWCGVCAILCRSNKLIAWSDNGTGVLLWGTSANNLLRARETIHSIDR